MPFMRSESCSFIWHPKVVRWYFFIPVQGNPSTNKPPLGAEVDWAPVEAPAREPLRGTHVVLRPVDAATDAEPLYALSHPPGGDPAIWTYLPDGPYEDAGQLRQMLAWAETAEDSLYFTLVSLRGPTAGARVIPAHHPRVRRDRDRPHLVRSAAAADNRGDRGDLPAGAPRLRRSRVPPARVEVQRAQRAVAAGGGAVRVHLRGSVPPTPGDQGAQPRHGVVCDHR